MLYLTILRLLHISLGVFWAGATIYLAAFVAPAVQASGPEGSKFMQNLARTNKLPLVMMIAATLNVLTGILLLWELSAGFQPSYMGSAHGIILSFGGTLAIIAYIIGLSVTRPTVDKVAKLGMTIAQSGGVPNAEQKQLLDGFRKKIFSANKMVAILLAFAVVAMSIVRYF
jgi:hypothetical protein